MKKTIVIVAALLVAGVMSGQTTQEFKARFDRQVKNAGPSGVGVETILDRWEEAFPEDGDMLEGRYSFWLSKARYNKVETRKEAKYLGAKPILTLKDSTGVDVNYFQLVYYVDSLFARSMTAIDKAISLYPDEFAYRIDRINALLSYERESPDMAEAGMLSLIDYHCSAKPEWKYYGEPMDEENFISVIQEYCYTLFKEGMPGTFDAFRAVSEKMLSRWPSNTVFLSNMGSYWYAAAGNNRQALKYYNKVLKLSPDDYTAAKNCVLIARREKDTKLEKKYLPALIRTTPSETERESCKARLEALSKK